MCFGILGMEWHLLALDEHIFAISLHRCNINRTNVSKNILAVTTKGEDSVFSVPRSRRELSPPNALKCSTIAGTIGKGISCCFNTISLKCV